MTRIQWKAPVNPRYESGVDRGVLDMPLYVVTAWNGLISVEEITVGGERTANHFDGVKISESVATRNWQGVIRAYSYPTYLANALGYVTIKAGFYLTRQPRTPFNFSYRVKVGDGSYKLHVVYNATIIPSHPARKTLSDVPDPDIYEWTVNAVPWTGTTTTLPARKPSAHYVVDSSKITSAQLTAVENALYGDPAVSNPLAAFPSPQTLFDLVSV